MAGCDGITTITPTKLNLITPQPTETATTIPNLTITPTDTPAPLLHIGDAVEIVPYPYDQGETLVTFLGWEESEIAVKGPYIEGLHYTFTAKPGMKFIVISFEYTNIGIRPQHPECLHNGEVTTNIGHIYSAWEPPLGVHSEEYNPRIATEQELETVGTPESCFEELMQEETRLDRIAFEIPEVNEPITANIFGLPYNIVFTAPQP